MAFVSKKNLPASLAARMAPVCIAVTADDSATLFARAEQALAESTFLELRLDGLINPDSALHGPHTMQAFTQKHPEALVLATCRRIEGGGAFMGRATNQLMLLLKFAQAGAGLVDVELETLEAIAPEMFADFNRQVQEAGAEVLVSAHDFEKTGDLAAILERLRTHSQLRPPAIFKVVSTATSLADNLPLLRLIEEADVPVVGICMGPAGLPSRVLALRSGAPFTFATPRGGEVTGSGQVSAELLTQEYRATAVTDATQLYGVVGNPVAHSLSPALHNAAFRAAGIDAIYLPLHTTDLPGLLDLVHGLPVSGLSITMPWKVQILPHLAELDPLARKIGAVNTVMRRADGSLYGTNTDAAAIVEPLAQRLALPGARILLAGAGGAARAAAFALRNAGASVAILNRTRAAAEALAKESDSTVADADALGRFDAVINATPAGMMGSGFETLLPVPESALDGSPVVFEMVYRPLETPLVTAARQRGLRVIDGLEMFAHQGARQWALWTSLEPPIEVMRTALETALRI